MPNVKFRNTIEKELTDEELKSFQKCVKDIIEFTKFVEIFNPKMGWINVFDNLYTKQKEILIDLQKNWQDKFIVLLSPRQSGKTILTLIFILWLITTTTGSIVSIVANKKEVARKIFRRFTSIYKRLPSFLRLSPEISDSKTEIEFADGTLVSISATTSSGLRTESVTLLYWDEAAWVKTDELKQQFYQSNYPILERMEGGFIVSSTPNGSGELFHTLYQKTQKNHQSYDPKWVLEKINWGDVFGRDELWKQQKIRDLSAGGKNGAEIFEQEYNNSFDVVTGVVRFFNQDSIAKLQTRSPLFEWVPNKNFIGESIKIFDVVGSQHFVVGIDIAEGIFGNFSTMIGLSIHKKYNNIENPDLLNYEIRQAFQYMNSGILPGDFFKLTMYFLITQLNDQWFLTFEQNDVGRLYASKLQSLIDELITGEFSAEFQTFKDLIPNKFGGDNQLFVDYLCRRVFRKTGKKGFNAFGLKSEKHINPLLKDNLKSLIDRGIVKVYEEHLLEELRLFEAKKHGETLSYSDYQGIGHFDLIQGLKFGLWPLRDRSTITDILNITPLKSRNSSQEQQYLEAILGANQNRNPGDFLKEEMRKDCIKELSDGENVPLTYNDEYNKDAGDITSLWNTDPVWFRRIRNK